MRPLLVLEDTTRPRWRLGRALGVEWRATGRAWVGPLFWIALGWGVAWAERGDGGGGRLAAQGTAYGLLLWLVNGIHTLGHVAASRLAGTPMDGVVLTSTRDVTVYLGAKREAPARIRAARSLGGPLANALVGAAALALAGPRESGGEWLRAFGVFNVVVAAWTLMPVPTLDGWLVWRWILGRRRRG